MLMLLLLSFIFLSFHFHLSSEFQTKPCTASIWCVFTFYSSRCSSYRGAERDEKDEKDFYDISDMYIYYISILMLGHVVWMWTEWGSEKLIYIKFIIYVCFCWYLLCPSHMRLGFTSDYTRKFRKFNQKYLL